MILQALVKYYDNVLAISIATGWQQRKANYMLDIDCNGNIQNSSAVVEINELMPALPNGRTSGIKPGFLCDNGSYIFGVSKPLSENDKKALSDDEIKKKEEKRAEDAKNRYKACREHHLKILENETSERAAAIKKFFNSQTPKDMPTGVTPDTNIVFFVGGKKSYEDNDIKKAWNSAQAGTTAQSDTQIIDLVTGNKDVIAKLHGNIKGLGKDSPSLININKEAFASYGNTKDDPAAFVGEQSAFKYVTALNSLIADKNHRSRFDDTSLVYWAENGEGDEESIFTSIWDMKVDETDESKLSSLIKTIKDGKPIQKCKLDSTFHILYLSLQSKRIVVRNYYCNTFGKTVDSIISHYEHLQITDDDYSKLTPFHLLGNTTVKKDGNYGECPPLLGGQLLNSIISGSRYPMTLYNAILTRIRAGEDINKTKAAIVKAVLIRNYNEQEVKTVALNTETKSTPYILGRLFSVLERLQEKANGSATIRERYFATACANPASIFPTILKLSMHHADKLDNAVFFEKLKTELLGKLESESPFPKALSLDDQGRFILGYYHQTQDVFTKKDKTEGTINV